MVYGKQLWCRAHCNQLKYSILLACCLLYLIAMYICHNVVCCWCKLPWNFHTYCVYVRPILLHSKGIRWAVNSLSSALISGITSNKVKEFSARRVIGRFHKTQILNCIFVKHNFSLGKLYRNPHNNMFKLVPSSNYSTVWRLENFA